MAKAKAAEEEGVDFGDGGDAGEGLVVDLSDVDESGTFEAIPRGVYNCVINALTYEMSKASGNPMWSVQMEVEDGEHAGRWLFTHAVFTPGGMPRVKKFLIAIGENELLTTQFKPEEVAAEGKLLGARLRARVDIRPYEGKPSNNVRAVMPPESSGSDFLQED